MTKSERRQLSLALRKKGRAWDRLSLRSKSGLKESMARVLRNEDLDAKSRKKPIGSRAERLRKMFGGY